MLKAKKGNRVVKIPDEKKKTYIALGYTITDMQGNMVYEHVEPSEKLEEAEKEIADLKELAEDYRKKNADLESKLEEAEKEIADLKEKLEKSSVDGSEQPDDSEVSEQPSKTETPVVVDEPATQKVKKTAKASSKSEK